MHQKQIQKEPEADENFTEERAKYLLAHPHSFISRPCLNSKAYLNGHSIQEYTYKWPGTHEETLNIITHQDIGIKTTVRYQ